jgi:hypothetical protein
MVPRQRPAAPGHRCLSHPEGDRDQEFFELDFVKKDLDFRSFDLPEKVPVDADFLRLAGYYLPKAML